MNLRLKNHDCLKMILMTSITSIELLLIKFKEEGATTIKAIKGNTSIPCLWQALIQLALHQEPVTAQVLRIQQAQPTLRQQPLTCSSKPIQYMEEVKTHSCKAAEICGAFSRKASQCQNQHSSKCKNQCQCPCQSQHKSQSQHPC